MSKLMNMYQKIVLNEKDIEELKFDEKGLIPAIVVDAKTKKVTTKVTIMCFLNKIYFSLR